MDRVESQQPRPMNPLPGFFRKRLSLALVGVGLFSAFALLGVFWASGRDLMVAYSLLLIPPLSVLLIYLNRASIRRLWWLPVGIFTVLLIDMLTFAIAPADPLVDKLVGLTTLMLPPLSFLLAIKNESKPVRLFNWLVAGPLSLACLVCFSVVVWDPPSARIAGYETDTASIVAYRDQSASLISCMFSLTVVRETPVAPGLVRREVLDWVESERGSFNVTVKNKHLIVIRGLNDSIPDGVIDLCEFSR